MEKSKRTLKVVRAFSAEPIPKPCLPLSGHWLERAGFKIGSRVDVEVRPGCLTIRPAKLSQGVRDQEDGAGIGAANPNKQASSR